MVSTAIRLIGKQIWIRLHVIHRAVHSMDCRLIRISGDIVLDFICWHHDGSSSDILHSACSHRLVVALERCHIVHFVLCGFFHELLFARSRCGWHYRLLFNIQYVELWCLTLFVSLDQVYEKTDPFPEMLRLN